MDGTGRLSLHWIRVGVFLLPALQKAIGAVSATGLEALEGFEGIFDKGEQRYPAAMAGRTFYHPFNGFLDIALVINGLTKTWEPNFDFLRTLKIANPELTGWPIWLVGESLPNPEEQPYFWHDTYEHNTFTGRLTEWTVADTWISLFSIPRDNYSSGERLKMIWVRMARGKRRRLSRYTSRAFELLKHWRFGRALANALGASVETTLSFAFRWSGIKNREIDLWAHPGAEFMSAKTSRQDTSQCEVTIAASANDEEIVARTVDALQKLVPFGDVKIPRQFLSEKLRTDLFKH